MILCSVRPTQCSVRRTRSSSSEGCGQPTSPGTSSIGVASMLRLAVALNTGPLTVVCPSASPYCIPRYCIHKYHRYLCWLYAIRFDSIHECVQCRMCGRCHSQGVRDGAYSVHSFTCAVLCDARRDRHGVGETSHSQRRVCLWGLWLRADFALGLASSRFSRTGHKPYRIADHNS
jgi:hypothetical protein